MLVPVPGVNQRQIAEKLAISRATVSRCFTNHPGINPVTRAKVFQLASQLGYQHMEPRDASKRKRRETKTVGVLICSTEEEYNRQDYESPGTEIHAGIAEYAQIHKIQLDLRYVEPGEKSVEGDSYRKIEPLKKREWDGILLIYPFPRAVIDALRLSFSVVSLVEQFGSSFCDCVDVDHFKGIAALMNRLADRGHERIGFYTKHYEVEAGWSFRRLSAYLEKLARLRQPMIREDIVNVFPNSFDTLDASYDHVARRIADGVTAWVCAADHQAYDLIKALARRGIRVPRDASVTGFDGIHTPEGMRPLTTAVIPYREIGFTGAKRLHDLLKKRFASPQHISVASKIQEGETIGPAPTPKPESRSR